MIKSPCKGKCKQVNNRCAGCGRTIHEIANWSNLTQQQKQQVIERINNDNLEIAEQP